MLFVTVQVGVHTYASRNPSSLCVTMIRSSTFEGDQAIRTARTGLPAVACSVSLAQLDPSHVRVFGLLNVFVPVFDRYPIAASTAEVLFQPLQAMWGLLFESVETVGMYPAYGMSAAIAQ